ncbi:hypothetical protein BCV70DRAFT_216110 [Testicularia cyperi]|uniref:tRNA-specific adenosine deaminase 1 n=1 Tax=Testicularia cyperi TaxID=1882483 RepID=A0A317XUF4_9BASI|nr:hypothetical protein BCV70DRAFT_216110 [Testicularia cyperi]
MSSACCDIDHDAIARLCVETYQSRLPSKGAKPTTRSNGLLEWTILAGFVISYPSPQAASGTGDATKYAVISLATGLKCLPYSQLGSSGDVLHDTHAEVLARRGARKWLLSRLVDEIERDKNPAENSDQQRVQLFTAAKSSGRWALRPEVGVHLYVSTLPCGSASNRLLEFQRAAQDLTRSIETANGQTVSPLHLLQSQLSSCSSAQRATTGGVRRGRAATETRLGLRTKPGRPDSPPSISMSCSDKLALWSSVGIQGSLLSGLIEPVHLSGLVIGDEALDDIFPADHEQSRAQLAEILRDECSESINRLRQPRKPVDIVFTSISFPDSRESRTRLARQQAEQHDREFRDPVSAAGSVLFIAATSITRAEDTARFEQPTIEHLVAGTRLGAPTKRKMPSDALKPAARSGVCKLDWWRYFSSIVPRLPLLSADLDSVRTISTYFDAKRADAAKDYRNAKAAILGEDSDEMARLRIHTFLQDRNNSIKALNGQASQDTQDAGEGDGIRAVSLGDTRTRDSRPPFQDWLVTPSSHERFNLDGRAAT